MNLTATQSCPACQRPLPGDSAASMCPACLMWRALDGGEVADEGFTSEDTLAHRPSPPEMAVTEGLLVAVDDDEPSGPPTMPQTFGGYQLLKVLGKGGMGIVYEAEQLATGRRVALKMLGRRLQSPEVKRRFLREGRLAAGVSHPNSVYVFGTEEIDGLPVITMEVAGGGTLQDVLDRRGQLPMVEAVDAMLDVIEGLEAALSKEVLHRDIKPSNCFVDPDGRVKVGDFGLSVSTVTGVDTFATATGVALGTPAFASPEQLRGDDLDHRSDIYAIGSTLYTLLAGHQPFTGTNAVQVVAAVLDQVPKSLTLMRPDIPVELAAVVSKCLSKKRELRFDDYASLRAALLPFSSRQPEPEPPPVVRRALAGMIDASIAWTIPRTVMSTAVGSLYFGELWQTSTFWPLMVLSVVWYVGYHTINEGRWGASVGKRLLSLRVMTATGRKIGYRQAFSRAALSVLTLQNFLLLQLVAAWAGADANWPRTVYAVLLIGLGLGMILVPTLTMRQSNRRATIWDLWTNTRVMMPVVGAVRIAINQTSVPVVDEIGGQLVGPYQTRRDIIPGQWIEAVDPALDRDVWLLRRAQGPELPSRRDVARSTRLRWLQSVQQDGQTWDAYETKEGLSLLAILHADSGHQKVHWRVMRHWLHDLSMELASASGDGSLPPELSLANVWITLSGHAVLLDQPYPGDSSSNAMASPVVDVQRIDGQQRLLDLVARQTHAHTVPLSARGVLANLAAGAFDRLSFLAGNLRSQLTRPAWIDRGSRATALLTVPMFLIATMFVSWQATEQTYRNAAARWTEAYPGLPPLSEVMRRRRAIIDQVGRQTLNEHLAANYKALYLGASDDLNDRVATVGDGAATSYLKRVLRTPPLIEKKALAEANQSVTQALELTRQTSRRVGLQDFARWVLRLFAIIAVLQLLSILATGRTLGQTIFAYAVVNQVGGVATRSKMFLRWVVVWSPVLMAAFMVGISAWVYVLLLPWLIGTAVAIAYPSRGWLERWTHTWLVPA